MNAEFLPPADAEVVAIDQDSLEIDFTTDFYGSGNGYTRLERMLLSIHTHTGRYITGIWGPDWTEIAPGVETCVKRSATTSGAQQRVIGKSVRIHQSACPVYLHYRQSYTYTDYDSSGESSSYDKWMCINSITDRFEEVDPLAGQRK